MLATMGAPELDLYHAKYKSIPVLPCLIAEGGASGPQQAARAVPDQVPEGLGREGWARGKARRKVRVGDGAAGSGFWRSVGAGEPPGRAGGASLTGAGGHRDAPITGAGDTVLAGQRPTR